MNSSKTSIKKDTPSYLERRTIRILLFITAILFLLAITLNIFNNPLNTNQWLDFWINVTLGATASAGISAIMLYIPFKFRISKTYQEGISQIEQIYAICDRMLTNNKNIDYLENLQKSEETLRKQFLNWYQQIDYSYEDIDEIIKPLTSDIPKISMHIKTFVKAYRASERLIEEITTLCGKKVRDKTLQELLNHLSGSTNKNYGRERLFEDFRNIIRPMDAHVNTYNLEFVNLNRHIKSLDDILEETQLYTRYSSLIEDIINPILAQGLRNIDREVQNTEVTH